MAKPERREYDKNKTELMELLPEALNEGGLQHIGGNEDLGVMSFTTGGEETYYIHISERTDTKNSTVSIAPGLPNLKEKPSSDINRDVIGEVFNNLEKKLG